MGIAAVVEAGLCVPAAEEVVGTEHSPLLEQQEEEQLKVRTKCGFTGRFSSQELMPDFV